MFKHAVVVKMTLKTFLISVLALGSFAANANLITNGSFEDFQGPQNASWFYFNPNDGSGWEGDNIEVWTTHGPESHHGDQHIELNAHPTNSEYSIFQQFNVVANYNYAVSFFYRARNTNGESFNMQIQFGDPMTAVWHNVDIANTNKTNWTEYTTVFTADTTGVASIVFTSLPENNGYDTTGNLLDSVYVTNVGQARVSTPGALLTFATGGLLLLARRKRAAK